MKRHGIANNSTGGETIRQQLTFSPPGELLELDQNKQLRLSVLKSSNNAAMVNMNSMFLTNPVPTGTFRDEKAPQCGHCHHVLKQGIEQELDWLRIQNQRQQSKILQPFFANMKMVKDLQARVDSIV
jgi:hypothetical protein